MGTYSMEDVAMRVRDLGWLALLAGLGVACGGTDSTDGGSNITIAKAAIPNGDNQFGTAADTLFDTLRVLVTSDGEPAVAYTVAWGASDNGAIVPSSSLTDSNGITKVRWKLGHISGPQTARATVARATGSPLIFNATSLNGTGASFGNTFFKSNKNLTSDPAVDTIPVGSFFNWYGTGGTHTVRSQGIPSFPSSGQLVGPATYQVLFSTVGTFQYDCSIHTSGMTGTLVVQDTIP